MTLVASINGPETIWLLADRRISWRTGPPKEDAQKVMLLRTADGRAILGYAGLGITALGTEPSTWMRAVLERRALPLEESLLVLAEAMERELPRHLAELPAGKRTHLVVAPAFYGDWGGSSARLYGIDLVRCPKHGQHFVARRYGMPKTGLPLPVALTGSGGPTLLKLLEKPEWRSTLRRMVTASAHGRILPHTVADYLARLNEEVRKNNTSVGPRCIVVWRHRLGGRRFGGGYLYYSHGVREHETVQLSLMPPLVSSESSGLCRAIRRHEVHESGKPVDDALDR